MGLQNLYKEKPNKSLPLTRRYSKKLVAQYKRDMRRVVDLENEGKSRPTRAALQEYFLSEYGMDISSSTIGHHLRMLLEGKGI